MGNILLGSDALTFNQLKNTFEYSKDIIEHLSPRALNDLLGGYENDVHLLFDSIIEETNRVINFHQSGITSDKIKDLSTVENCMHERLKILSYNYFKISCLPEFNQNWRNLEWGNMVQLYDYLTLLASRSSGKSHEFSFAYPLWQLYRYERPNGLRKDTLDNKLSKDTVIVTNSLGLGSKLLGKIKDEVDINDILAERLKGSRAVDHSFGAGRIKVKSGANIELRSFDKTIRGLHPGRIIVDDFLDKSAIYSAEQREKFNEVFFAEIMPALEPGGNIVTVGTPFHPDDLYEKLRNDRRFKLFEYPAILPNGQLLAPDRYGLNKLMAERDTLGSMVFAREYLITPISDTSSIFPWDFLRRSFVGMEHINYVENIESFPIKLKRVVTACDLAISGTIGADYCAFITGGLDSQDNFYVLNIWHKQGASHNEQVNQIVSINDRFKPSKIVVENNGFQRVIANLARERGLRNIEEFTQTNLKKDLLEGFPALGATFERGVVRLPYAHGETRDMTMKMCSELAAISFDDSKKTLEASSGHDDLAHSLFILFHDLFFNKKVFRASLI